ncbi:MAG: F0F1 ATP synthase subunit B [Clostridiales Family XIII bacterium]|jgi:F-type H+-transporting ATPase subunit b|nr:F0F1 ATP synthase subunit B [Clostridiales Family XIII bacterium]
MKKDGRNLRRKRRAFAALGFLSLVVLTPLLSGCAKVSESGVGENGETIYTTSLIGFDWTFVMILITFAVLYIIVKKFFFDKIHGFMEARAQKVQDQFDSAEAKEQEADKHLADYGAKLENIELERREILKEAKAKADARAAEIVDEANEKAAAILAKAEADIERERKDAAEAMKDQVAMLAIYAAERILEKELDEKKQLAFVDDILKESGAETWTH